jgi:hypothetical protein
MCPFCGYDPYDYVDVGIGRIPVAITCCEDQAIFHAHGPEALVGKRSRAEIDEIIRFGAEWTETHDYYNDSQYRHELEEHIKQWKEEHNG